MYWSKIRNNNNTGIQTCIARVPCPTRSTLSEITNASHMVTTAVVDAVTNITAVVPEIWRFAR